MLLKGHSGEKSCATGIDGNHQDGHRDRQLQERCCKTNKQIDYLMYLNLQKEDLYFLSERLLIDYIEDIKDTLKRYKTYIISKIHER